MTDGSRPYDLPDAHLLEPFWRTDVVYGETVFFIQEEEGLAPSAPLLFEPREILSVTGADGQREFHEGSDYVVDAAARTVSLPPDSPIPFMKREGLYRHAGQTHGIAHKAGEEDVLLYWGEGAGFHDRQAAVTYRHEEAWDGYVPTFAGDQLPRTRSLLAGGKPLTLCASGDSITAGANASKTLDMPPYQPPWVEMVPAVLRRECGSDVTLCNYSEGGAGIQWGIPTAERAAEDRPDLYLIGYGMNNVRDRDPRAFGEFTAAILDAVRSHNPETEFILLASMLGNPEWAMTPEEMFGLYRDELRAFCGPGVVLADLTAMWTDLLRRKTFLDLTGNGVNHPNDFGHRIYAQTLLAVLLPEA